MRRLLIIIFYFCVFSCKTQNTSLYKITLSFESEKITPKIALKKKILKVTLNDINTKNINEVYLIENVSFPNGNFDNMHMSIVLIVNGEIGFKYYSDQSTKEVYKSKVDEFRVRELNYMLGLFIKNNFTELKHGHQNKEFTSGTDGSTLTIYKFDNDLKMEKSAEFPDFNFPPKKEGYWQPR